MKTLARNLAVIGIFVLCPASSAWADFQKGLAAYQSNDYAAALKEWRPLAEQGLVKAQYNLGVMYDKGRGVPQDYTKAVHWYRRAADQRFALAQYNLGAMYTSGYGVPKDYALAYMWYSLAAAQGDKKGLNSRDVLAPLMTPAQIARAQKLAGEWKPVK